MELAWVSRGYCEELNPFLFEREREGYKRFAACTVHNLGPRSRHDLDLQYSLTLINSIRCLLLPTFRSLAAITSEKSTIFTFSFGKAKVTKFDLAIKLVKVNPGSSFEQTMMGLSP